MRALGSCQERTQTFPSRSIFKREEILNQMARHCIFHHLYPQAYYTMKDLGDLYNYVHNFIANKAPPALDIR